MFLDSAGQDGLITLPRRGARCILANFKLPESIPSADVLYCDYSTEASDRNFRPYWLIDDYSLFCDLTLSEDHLFGEINRNTRDKINHAERRDGFVFKVCSPQDISESDNIVYQFADFYDGFARSKGLSPLRRDDALALARAGLLWLAAAEKDGEILHWTCFVAAHGRARMRHTCSHVRREPEWRSIVGRAHRWLVWRAMRMFRDKAFTTFDFGGWYTGTEDQALLRINAFKEGFGGVPTRLYSMAIPLSVRGRAYLGALDVYKRSKARLGAARGAAVSGNDQPGHASHPTETPEANRLDRITFVINEMTLGGAERVMAIMANYWAERGRRVTIITVAPKSAAEYELDDRVLRMSIALSGPTRSAFHGLVNNLRRLVALRRDIALTRPDVVIGFMVTTNILTILATRLLGVPVIVAEHTTPALSPRGRGWAMLRRATYPMADRVVVLTRDAAEFFWPSLRPRIRVIPNPVRALAKETPLDSAASAHAPFIVTVGRLEAEKQIDHILSAFAGLADRFPQWKLINVGDGSLRDSLKKRADELGVGSRVEWTGSVRTPEDYLRRAGLFVLPSLYEGLPCAMQEAMACGLPVVSYDCSAGIRELLRDGRDGILVPPSDVGQLEKAMAGLMEDPARRAQLGEAALAVKERYSVGRIMKIWEDELRDLVSPRVGPASGAQFLVRFDDICPTMNWEVWREIETILVEHDVKPILAVVPDNRDPVLQVSKPNPHFWDEVRKWQSWGWTIGLHGYQHAYVTKDWGCMGINRYSEFAGLPAAEQREKLRRGLAIFREQGVKPGLWIAPAHSFDDHTLAGLQAEGVDVVSDGFFTAPGRDHRGMFWVPQQLWWFAARRRGVWTVCMHHNAWTQATLAQFRDDVGRWGDRLTTVDEMLEAYGARRLSTMDNAYAKAFWLRLRARAWLRAWLPSPLYRAGAALVRRQFARAGA